MFPFEVWWSCFSALEFLKGLHAVKATVTVKLFFFNYYAIFRQDSYVNDDVNFDLLREIELIQDGLKACPELLGYKLDTKTKDDVPEKLIKSGCPEGLNSNANENDLITGKENDT